MKTTRSSFPIRARLAAVALAATAFIACSATVQADPVQSYIFGISDANDIYQINPTVKSFTDIYSTTLTAQSNALAFDRARDQMFFMNQSGTFAGTPYTNGLFLWNKPLNTFSLLAQGSEIDVPTGDIPANASFYDNAFWFFKEGTKTLVKASLTYSGSTPTGVSGFVTYTMDTGSFAPSDSQNIFGDIAINPSGVLYGYTAQGVGNIGGQFYSLDLTTVSGSNTLANYSLINTTTGTGLQIAFNQDYSILYGHQYSGGQWYEINTSSGALTDLSFTTIVPGGPAGKGFRDLAGASIAPVPEPGTMALALVGMAGAGYVVRRRVRRQLTAST